MLEFRIGPAVFLVLAAPCVGSFLGLIADRLPRGESVIGGRSHCDNCRRPLAMRDLIPILGWAINRGRCRSCGARVSALYPLIELGALALGLWSLLILPGWLAYAGASFGWLLLVLAVVDWRAGVLPDRLTIPLLALGFLVAALAYPDRLYGQALGATLGFVLLWLAARIYRWLRHRDGMGDGDPLLLSAIGAWVGWQGLASVILIAAASGLGVALFRAARRGGLSGGEALSFGPYLALGGWLVWLYGPISFG